MMRMPALVFLLIPFTLSAAQYEYLVKFDAGKEQKVIGAAWSVEKISGVSVIHEVTANMTQTVKCDAAGSAVEWDMQARTAEGGKVDLRGVRMGNKISVTGIMKDKPYSKVFDIDDKPWYQAVDMQMKGFIDSDKDYTEFWMVGMTPEFTAFTMSFKKGVTETVKAGGRDYDCRKMEWRATGFWALFWSSDYWFRKSDGVAVKFAMPGGNDPKATSELINQK
jgi:hypothetical protein